jgi:hypothetical protein
LNSFKNAKNKGFGALTNTFDPCYQLPQQMHGNLLSNHRLDAPKENIKHIRSQNVIIDLNQSAPQNDIIGHSNSQSNIKNKSGLNSSHMMTLAADVKVNSGPSLGQPSPNTQLYQKLLHLVSNSSEYSSQITSQMSTLLLNPNIRAHLKKLHMQLLEDPDHYLPQLESILLSHSSINTSTNSGSSNGSMDFRKQSTNSPNKTKIAQDLLELRNYYFQQQEQTNGNSTGSVSANPNTNMLNYQLNADGLVGMHNSATSFYSNMISKTQIGSSARTITREFRR